MVVVNRIFISCAVILSLSSGLAVTPPSETIRVVSRGPNSLIVAVQPFNLRANSFKIDDVVYHRIEIPGFGVFTEPGSPMLPQTGVVLQVPPGATVRAAVVEQAFEEVTDLQIVPAPEIEEKFDSDRISYRYEKNAAIYSSDTFWPAERVEVTSRGRFRGRELVRVQLNPVQYNPVTRVLRVYRTLRVEIACDGERATQAALAKFPKSGRDAPSFILNADVEVASALPSPADRIRISDWYDPQTDYYKIAVDETGIYKLSHEDLLAAGVPIQQVDPNALKMFNLGEEIPIWISGPNTGAWTPDNAIYFYGERHAGDSTYYDFYSDTNIYWLALDGARGKRYRLVEEGQPAEPAAYYRETLHLEQENLFHRTNSTSAIDAGETWIWRYLFANQQETVPFETSALYEGAELCSLRVRIRGTTRDPASPDHHVRFYINSQTVGDVFFDEEQTVVWEGTFPVSLLKPDGNNFKILLVPDTGAQINQIYLDWIEVVYPRSLVAQQNRLKFIPQSGGGTADFFLSNFGDSNLVVLAPETGKVWQPTMQKQSLYRVESAGFDDGYFLRMFADSRFFRFTQRGHGLLALDPETGAAEMRSFDTFASAEAADDMAQFIGSLTPGTVVLAGIIDEGSAQMTEAAYLALESLGSTLTRQVGGRDSWALIGWKGAPAGSVAEVLSKRFDGPAVASDTLSGEQAYRFTASFQDTVAGGSFYYAASDSGVRKPASIKPDESSELRSSSNGADYIIITHEKFMQEAQQLANYRAQHNGFRTMVVDVEDIYDEFNYGVLHPQAIKDFLTVAYSRWQPPAPQFLVLLGDASWDPNKRMPESVKENYVTSYGSLVSDNWYVSLDGPDDALPDLFAGRIPVETPEQARMVIQKVMAYEQLAFDGWSKEFLFFNGGINSYEQTVFTSQADALIQQHISSPPLAAVPLRFNKTTNEAISQQFRNVAAEEIRRGALWVNFIGHAGSAVWDIDIGQPDDWQNAEIFPFFTGMSCHSARFANPSRNSLSENFVLDPRGAVAYWGSSGFGYINQDFYLLDGLFAAVAGDSVRRAGEATTLAKLSVWQRLGDQQRTRGVIDQYTLIGDPALRLRLPNKPEFAVRQQEIEFGSDLLLTVDSTTTVSAQVHNFGLIPTDSVTVGMSVRDQVGSAVDLGRFVRPPFGQRDSVTAIWSLPDLPGEYDVQIEVDPENKHPEEDETNNLAVTSVQVFASDLTLIKPVGFGVVTQSNPDLVTGNSKTTNPGLSYYFEIDTSRAFGSPALQQSPPVHEGELVTRWQPQLTVTGTYFWRVRTFDGIESGPWAESSMAYLPGEQSQWLQSSFGQFEQNVKQEVAATFGGVQLANRQLVFSVESAGFLDGAHALISLNDEIVGAYFRGHNVAVFDGRDARFLDFQVFDTFSQQSAASALADFVNGMQEGDFVIAAIVDEGTAAMTEEAYLALESIGSRYTREVAFRDSWAIIGRKGASIGSVPEAWSPAGEGGVTVTDTVSRVSTSGAMLSPEIGPALQWRTLDVAHQQPPNTQIAVQVLGRNAETGGTDTLVTNLTKSGPVDLSGIDPGRYPRLRLQARLRSQDGVTTPSLERWAVAYAPPPDLLVDNGSLVVARDTLVVGEVLDAQVKIGNFGLAGSDSFSVRLVARANDGASVELLSQLPGLGLDELMTRDLQLDPGTDLLGRIQLSLEVDSAHEIPEINESNNQVTAPFWVVADTVGPDLRITFDGVEVAFGEYVTMNPNIVIELRDRGQATFADSGLVTVFLDDDKVPYGEGQGQARFLPQNTEGQLKALVTFQPRLSGGEHEIEIVAKDESDNVQVVRTEFSVSASFALTDVMNYPNPFRDATEFTYNLTQPADLVKLKIYTVSGRLIQELEFLPGRVGFNQFEWDGRDADHDILANGVYFYKIIARNGEQQVEVLEKLAVVR